MLIESRRREKLRKPASLPRDSLSAPWREAMGGWWWLAPLAFAAAAVDLGVGLALRASVAIPAPMLVAVGALSVLVAVLGFNTLSSLVGALPRVLRIVVLAGVIAGMVVA
jgi:hypothetical protein